MLHVILRHTRRLARIVGSLLRLCTIIQFLELNFRDSENFVSSS